MGGWGSRGIIVSSLGKLSKGVLGISLVDTDCHAEIVPAKVLCGYAASIPNLYMTFILMVGHYAFLSSERLSSLLEIFLQRGKKIQAGDVEKIPFDKSKTP